MRGGELSAHDHWGRICGAREDVDPGEQFLESSKLGRFDAFPPQEVISQRLLGLLESFSYDGYPATALPSPQSIDAQFSRVISSRVSARAMKACPLGMTQLAALLHYSYGITRTNEGTGFPRPFRSAPSGGGLYPLEIYFHSNHVVGLPPGLYHYNPLRNNVRLLRAGDHTSRIKDSLVQFQRAVAHDLSALFFLTAVFERSTFKYGARAYRFIFLEAGHVAQNLNLVATALGLGCLNIGGYYDREIDGFLGLDGISHSTIYMVAVSELVDLPSTSAEP